MPELPEVETIRHQLTKYLPGLTLHGIEVFEAKLKADLDPEGIKRILGQKVMAVERVAKVLLLRFEKGDYLAFHLKMTGQVVISNSVYANSPNQFNRAILTFSNSTQIFFQDLRKFGWIKVLKKEEVPNSLFREKLGPEPFSKDFTLKYLSLVLKKSQKPIKVLLLDQAQIAGIGNIYANEALFLSGIHPSTKAKEIEEQKIPRLYQAILSVLRKGIDLGGASDNSYLNAYGLKGKYQNHFLVYRRQNQKCPNCDSKIIRIALGGRGTFYCPICQKPRAVYSK